jgi:glycosyltransferase involved in cell wall biosynthesis
MQRFLCLRGVGVSRQVLHVLPHRGGGGEAVVEMLLGLNEFDHERCYLAGSRKPLRAAPTLARGLRQVRYKAQNADLLHVVGDTAAALCAPLFRNHPAVWSTQGLHLLRRVGLVPSALLEHHMRSVLASARRTICSSRSEFVEMLLIAPDFAQRLTEIPNGIPLPIVPSAAERAAARRALGFGEDMFIALYLGELEPRKRPLDAVTAAQKAAGHGVPIVLVVAGTGPMAAEVTAQGAETVRILGFQADPSPLLMSADVFLMPSEREGLSLALLEAMAYSLPIIASDGRGNPDAVGDSGLLHRVGDTDALASSIVRLADNPEERRRLGASARVRAEEKFSLDRFLSDMQSVFNTSMARLG